MRDLRDLTRYIVNRLATQSLRTPEQLEDTQLGLQLHLVDVSNWSREIQFYGMSIAKPIGPSTINLTIDTVPRRFRGERSNTPKIGEISLLNDPGHILLLGDPGAGKTTTIKRLTRFLLSDSEPQESNSPWLYPIVVRLKELSSTGPTLLHLLAEILGLRHEMRAIANTTMKFERPFLKRDLEILIARILDATRAILFFDGLDETSVPNRDQLEAEIIELTGKLSVAKVVLSCRSGEFTHHLDGFKVFEICPLEGRQIYEIANKWLDNSSELLRHLQLSPFADLASRPLFLCYLLVFFQNTGYLPDQPSAVYRRVTRLVLEEWDRQRTVRRGSRYASFDPDKKLDFLSAISYHLTYRSKLTRFSTNQLADIYRSIAPHFNLPIGEAEAVAREIEAHTGIIVESGTDYYEFSHLSLQEFLCAYYLVREPFAEHLSTYLKDYPSPVAVAVSLSANPSTWLAALILNPRIFSELSQTSLISFLTRVIQEKPGFSRSIYLGFAILKMVFLYGHTLERELAYFIDNTDVSNSVVEALSWYSFDKFRSNEKSIWLSKVPASLPERQFYPAEEGSLPRELLASLERVSDVTVVTKHGRKLELIWATNPPPDKLD